MPFHFINSGKKPDKSQPITLISQSCSKAELETMYIVLYKYKYSIGSNALKFDLLQICLLLVTKFVLVTIEPF